MRRESYWACLLLLQRVYLCLQLPSCNVLVAQFWIVKKDVIKNKKDAKMKIVLETRWQSLVVWTKSSKKGHENWILGYDSWDLPSEYPDGKTWMLNWKSKSRAKFEFLVSNGKELLSHGPKVESYSWRAQRLWIQIWHGICKILMGVVV